MIQSVAEATEVLSRTPSALRAQLAGLSEGWLHADEGPGTYSPFDVVGHLLSGERTDWIPRMRSILDHGEARTFEPFDRDAFRATLEGLDLEARLDAFAEERAANLRSLATLLTDEAQLSLKGTHPDFGTVTAGQLLATWVTHDLSHLAQIARTMAGRQREAVGPWLAYLPILAPRP